MSSKNAHTILLTAEVQGRWKLQVFIQPIRKGRLEILVTAPSERNITASHIFFQIRSVKTRKKIRNQFSRNFCFTSHKFHTFVVSPKFDVCCQEFSFNPQATAFTPTGGSSSTRNGDKPQSSGDIFVGLEKWWVCLSHLINLIDFLGA